MTEEKDYVPSDWNNPDWGNPNKCHDWKNYIANDVKVLWDTFTDVAKQALASNFDSIASQEDWD